MVKVMPLKSIIATALFTGATCLAQVPLQLKVVKSSPFSAQAVTQSTQELVDGNRIVHQTTAFIARDSEGRTRREQRLATGSVSAVFIQDPVAGVVYVLDPQAHSARKIVIALSETDSSPIKSLVPIVGGGHPADNSKSEALGIQIIEGFVVQGTRLTRSLPVGQAGNERPLEIVSEAWYSDELQTLLMNKTTDPRIGDTVYRLTGIQRGEPSPSLFRIPPEYTIKDE